MIIAVDTDGLKEETGNFLHECLRRIIPASPQHIYVLLSKNKLLESYQPYTNCLRIALTKQNALLSLQEINDVLKKQKADILLTGNILLAASTKIKCGFLTASLIPVSVKTFKVFFNHFLLKKSYKNASLIFAAWKIEKQNITDEYKLDKERVQVIHYGINDIAPVLNFEDQQIIQAKYAEGFAYFLISQEHITAEQLLFLLKAFSIFKKKLKSTMKFLVYTKNYNYENINKLLKDYRFKTDVILCDQLMSSSTEIFKGAYAIIFSTIQSDHYQMVLKAIALSTAAICYRGLIEEEIFDDAALYYNEFVPEQIAANMMLLYKDENLKKSLSAKAQARHELFSWDRSAGDFRLAIEKAFG